MAQQHAGEPSPPAERGTALIWALMVVIVSSGMVVSHSTLLAALRKERTARFNQGSLASTFARSGMVDTVGWFRRQQSQPVSAFDPQLDLAANPPVLDTMDPVLGLVREFEIQGNLWGRYEIQRREVRDISAERGLVGAGGAWEVKVRSYVYRRNDAEASFRKEPNRLVASSSLTNEIRNIPFRAPAPAALCVDDPAAVQVLSNGHIDGVGGSGIVTAPGTGSVQAVDGTLSGAPETLQLPTFDATPTKVFSMRLDELRGLSDFVMTPSSGTDWVRLNLDNKLIFHAGDLIMHKGMPVTGSLLVVDGDLIKQGGTAPSQFEGVVYVTGDVLLESAFQVRGQLIVRGAVRIGGGAERVSLLHDPDVVDQLRRMLGEDRERRSMIPNDALENTPDEAGASSVDLRLDEQVIALADALVLDLTGTDLSTGRKIPTALRELLDTTKTGTVTSQTFSLVKTQVVGNLKSLAGSINSGKVDASHAGTLHAIAEAATNLMRAYATDALSQAQGDARAFPDKIASATQYLTEGDAYRASPVPAFESQSVPWYQFELSIDAYKYARDDSRAAMGL